MMNFSMPGATIAINSSAGVSVAANAAPAPAPATASEAAPVPLALVLPFQHWIAVDAAPPEADPVVVTDGALPALVPEQLTEAEEPPRAADAPVFDVMLAAMTPQPMPVMLPAMMMAMPAAKPGVTAPTEAPLEIDAALPATARTGADIPDLAQPGAAPAMPRVDSPVTQAAAPAVIAPPAAPTATVAVAAEGDGDQNAPATTTTATSAATAVGAQPANARGADTVALAGPPTAWKQSLHEALGDRLQLQLGRGIEQATIRLEPPQLGRIEISVRHSGGNLEVHIAASNSDVLRQLNTVSDSLRNDLAGRQYSHVAVSVGETPRAQAAAQTGQQPSGQSGADAGGRGRQQEQQEQRQRTPGLALHDAGDAGSLFSMNERERP